jgi:hypothetical protein
MANRFAASVLAWSLVVLPNVGLAADPPAAKPPPPDAAALKGSFATVREVFKDDLAAAKRPEEKSAVAKKLLQAGTDEQKDLPGKFALLSLAKDLATEGGDLDAAAQAVDQMQQAFAVDGPKMKLDLVSARAKAAKTRDDRKLVAAQAQAMADEALDADRYDVAAQLADVSLAASRLADEPKLVRSATTLVGRCREAQTAYAEVKPAVATLAQKPTDPDANLKVGRYRCLARNDWGRGLPMLALGSDPVLKALAAKELAGAATPDEQMQLADGWWDAAGKLAAGPKANAQAHAARWYKEALPSVEKGLARAKAEDRLKQVERAGGATAAAVAPPGKWVPVFDSIDDFQKRWGRKAQAVSFEPKSKVVRVDGAWDLGQIEFPGEWRELSFDVRVEKLAFNNFDLNVGGYALKIGEAFKGRVPAEATVRVGFDEAAKQLYAAIGTKRVAEATVTSDAWQKKLVCRISSGGGQDAKMVIGNVRVRVP